MPASDQKSTSRAEQAPDVTELEAPTHSESATTEANAKAEASEAKARQAANKNTADEQSAANQDSASQLGEKASFIDTFAALEDLIRFQSSRFKALLNVAKAQLRLSSKALVTSFALAIIAGLLSFVIWMLINLGTIYYLFVAGLSVAISLMCALALNLLIFLWVMSQLRQAVKSVSLSHLLEMLSNPKD
jgi:uncharacterized membrane protein YdbT with pleckstrin-like domain